MYTLSCYCVTSPKSQMVTIFNFILILCCIETAHFLLRPDDVHFKYLEKRFVYEENSRKLNDSTDFKVALVTAGSIRSFAYVINSWNRYLLHSYKKNVFIFAHVAYSQGCPLTDEGLRLLWDIATNIEVVSLEALVSPQDLLSRVPRHYKKYFRKVKGYQRGNVADMYARRERVFSMAKHYANNYGFSWDLVIFMRMDTALYEPVLDLRMYHQNLVQHRELNNHTKNQRAIWIPRACDFQGVCDRLAIGLEDSMEIYFQKDLIYRVLDWTLLNITFENEEMTWLIKVMRGGMLREQIMMAWLYMNDIYIYSMTNTSFVTLRLHHALTYCDLNRPQFNYYRGVHWTDKVTSFISNHTSPYSGFDFVRSSQLRCGDICHLHLPYICKAYNCSCEQWASG